MALTITQHKELEDIRGVFRSTVIVVAGDNLYPSGGYPLSLRQLGMSHILRSVNIEDDTSGNYYVYNRTTNKLMVFVNSTGVEVAGNTDLHLLMTAVRIISEGT